MYVLRYRVPLLAVLLSVLVFTSFSFLQENSNPVVTIISPTKNTKFKWNSILPFTITVADKEDGYSEYDEIADKEVILTVRYHSDSLEAHNYLANIQQQDREVLSWMGRSECFSCHMAKDKLIGPSFEKIAEHYMGNPDAVEYLTKKIKNGASDTWGDQIMPAQPDLDKEKVIKTVNWILNNGRKPDYTYLSGTEGVIKTREQPKGTYDKAVYLLSAHYIDHGIDGKSEYTKQGVQHLMLKPQ